ncbi:MAG: SDR family NAD(P)-dependent oxidoreductase [Thermoleophilia bacterium]|nr:SDR family NAD(P)-dependent oxidoreductase [Thermoleophilia bacterium]
MSAGESKVWFITGTSKGFGRIWAEAALERGDRVAATARDSDTLGELVEEHGDAVLPLALDVTDKPAVDAAVAQAQERFDHLDVVVNNAGYGLFGTIEEVSEEQARAQIETNLFGALWVTKAALPQLREQGSGHIVQVSSIGGVQAFAGLGLYHASKWALEGFSQSLAAEVAPFGVHVTLIEPIGYTTDWAGPSSVQAEPMPQYDPIRVARTQSSVRSQRGEPTATSAAILELVDAEEPPLRAFFGEWALGMMREEYAGRIANWESWQDLAARAHQ